MYFTILVIVHVAGAIMGIGPSFGFAVLGAMADKGDDATKLTLFRAMTAIDSRLVTPVALVTQPVTGALLIFNRGINHGFFAVRHLWLIISIVFYIAILYVSYLVSRPRVRRTGSRAVGCFGLGRTCAAGATGGARNLAKP